MPQVHIKNSFYKRVCVCLSHTVILNNDQNFILFFYPKWDLSIFITNQRTITSWQYNNSSNTVNAQATGRNPPPKKIKNKNIQIP